MELIGRVSIGVRLVVGFTVVLLLTAAIGGLGIRSVQPMGDLTTNLYVHPFTVTHALLEARVQALTLELDVRDAARTKPGVKADAAAQALDATWQRATAALATARAGFLGDKSQFNAAEKAFTDYQASYRRVLDEVRQGKQEDAIQLARSGDALAATTRTMDPMIQFAVGKAGSFMRDAGTARSAAIETNASLLAGGMLVALIVA